MCGRTIFCHPLLSAQEGDPEKKKGFNPISASDCRLKGQVLAPNQRWTTSHVDDSSKTTKRFKIRNLERVGILQTLQVRCHFDCHSAAEYKPACLPPISAHLDQKLQTAQDPDFPSSGASSRHLHGHKASASPWSAGACLPEGSPVSSPAWSISG